MAAGWPRDSRSAGELSGISRAGDAAHGLDQLWPAVFRQLKRLAHHRLATERAGHTLSTTALVHETYLRLLQQRSVGFEDRAEFFAHASRAMRRILVDYARRHRAQRRGGAAPRVSLEELEAGADSACDRAQLVVTDRAEELLALDDALVDLETLAPRLARVVEARFFGGLTEQETAEALGVTVRTVERDWVKARLLLRRALET